MQGRGILGVDNARRQFVAREAQSVAVLAYHDKLALHGARYHVAPVGIFQNVELIIFVAVRQAYVVAPCGEPGAAKEVFRLQYGPFLRVIHA